jgi:hypothetical protein
MLPGLTFVPRRTHSRDDKSQAKEPESQSCRRPSLLVVSNTLPFMQNDPTIFQVPFVKQMGTRSKRPSLLEPLGLSPLL